MQSGLSVVVRLFKHSITRYANENAITLFFLKKYLFF